MFKIYIIFLLIGSFVECNFEIKDEKDKKFLQKSLKKLRDQNEIIIVASIKEFKGFLLYYIDQISRQIIVLLNFDKSMTIKFGCNDYRVDPNTNDSCVPEFLNNYTFVLNRTHILFKCNGKTAALVRACRKIDENYPLPNFTNYSALIYLANHEEFTNIMDKIITPSYEHPILTVEKLFVNGVPIIESNTIQSKNSSNAEEMITQSNFSTSKTIINSSVSDMEKNKTDISQTKWWIIYSIPFLIAIIVSIVLIAIIGFIVISIQHRRSKITNPTTDDNSSRNNDAVLEVFTESQFFSQNAQVPSDTIIQMEDHLSETVQSGITSNRSTDETQALIETGCLEENYSSQNFVIIFEKEREC